MKKNVLVFSGAPYPAMEICSCIKFNMLFRPVAAASYSNHSEFFFDETVNNLPFVNADNFIEEFVKVIEEKNISYIIPTDDTIAVELTKHQNELPAKVVCSPYKTALLCRHKKLTYEALKGECFVPRVYHMEEIDGIVDYPVFVKPDNGQGSCGAAKAENRDELRKIQDLENMVICEYLPGEEYTVDCFTDRFGKLIFCNPRSRSRIMNGITARGYNVPCTVEFQEIIDIINRRITFRGYWFAQMKRDSDGNLKLMELCCRFAGTFGVSKSLGANLPLMALCDAAGMDTDVIVNDYNIVSDKTYIDRYQIDYAYNTVYIDYDDTITFKNGSCVNPYVMSYLYQCQNLGRKIILLSRHSYDHDNSLEDDMRLLSVPRSLFTEIHDLSWNEQKSNYIHEQKSIFIDNSFAERKKVHDTCNIPVFDVTNIDCLFDWR